MDRSTGKGNTTHHEIASAILPPNGNAAQSNDRMTNNRPTHRAHASQTGLVHDSMIVSAAMHKAQASAAIFSPCRDFPKSRKRHLRKRLPSQNMVSLTVIKEFAAPRHPDLAHGSFHIAVHSFDTDSQAARNFNGRYMMCIETQHRQFSIGEEPGTIRFRLCGIHRM